MDEDFMDRIQILKDRATEIAVRMKVLGIKKTSTYLGKLVQHDLWVQGFRKRIGIVPFSEHRITWNELFKLFKNKIRLDYKKWRNSDLYD